MLKRCIFLLCSFFLLIFSSCNKPLELPEGLYAQMSTAKGQIILKLEYEKVPLTVANFVGLAEGSLAPSGKPYYNGTAFHRVIENFKIQAGEANDDFPGSPGYTFPDEFEPTLRHNKAGVLSMDNNGPNTNSSQFFITHKPTSWLDDKNPVFGAVVRGQEVVDKIKQGNALRKVSILRIGPGAEAFVVTKEIFAGLVAQASAKQEAAIQAAEEKRLQEEARLNPPLDPSTLADGLYARMLTSKGTVLLQLEFEKAPLTVSNFVGLAEGTLKSSTREVAHYFDGLTFHRVVANFMIQGGDPLGNGTGNPGYSFPDEFHPDLRHNGPGILSMANSGPDTNGSQFFITHLATPHLDDKHAVFGHVVQGMEVVNAIAQGDVIRKVEIYRIGAKADAFKVSQASFDALKAKVLKAREAAAARQQAEEQKLLSSLMAKARKTVSGLAYVVDKKGSGTTSPVMGTEVSVHYRGKLTNGQEFDSSYSRNAPSKFKIGQVIQGWNEALQLMHKGDKWTLIIPPQLGYGSQGTGPIPPNATLIFEVELIDF